MKLKKIKGVAILPSLLTLGNLVCGFLSIVYSSKSDFQTAAILIFVAMALDALDGKVARLTRTASNFGAQIDSLSDIVSFGVAPAMMIYCIITQNNVFDLSVKFSLPYRSTVFVSALYVICAALRLARFNVETTLDKSSHEHFAGLPSPGAGGVLASMVVFYGHLLAVYKMKSAESILIVMALMMPILAVLMVSRIRYVHLLNSFSRISPFARLLEVILFVLVMAFWAEFALFGGLMIYTLSGPFIYVRQRLFKKKTVSSDKLSEFNETTEESIF